MNRYAHEASIALMDLKHAYKGTGKWWVLDDVDKFIKKHNQVLTKEELLEYMDYRLSVAKEEFDYSYENDMEEIKLKLMNKTEKRLSVKQPGELLDAWILKTKLEWMLEDQDVPEEEKKGIQRVIDFIQAERTVLDLVDLDDVYGPVGYQIHEDVSNRTYQEESGDTLKKLFQDLDQDEEEFEKE
jgi:hypothetical protein